MRHKAGGKCNDRAWEEAFQKEPQEWPYGGHHLINDKVTGLNSDLKGR